MLKNSKNILTTLRKTIKTGGAGKILGATSKLAKFSGVLSAVTGAFTIKDGLETYQQSMQDGQMDAKTWVGGLDMLSGALSVVGGIAMFIPGGQPVAAVLLGASAVVSGISVVVENWSTIQSWSTNISKSVSNTVQSWFRKG